MRYSSDHKAEAREKLLKATGKGFRRQGYGGIGVDGLAKEAGVTSGSFYGHFKSKDAAFEAAAIAGLQQLLDAIRQLQETLGAQWTDAFVDFYLSERLTCALDDSCALQSMTADVMRAGESTKKLYQQGLSQVAEQIAKGLKGNSTPRKQKQAWALMALLSGGVTMLRSMADQEQRLLIAKQLKSAAKSLLD